MVKSHDLPFVRKLVVCSALAQTLFWLYTLLEPRDHLLAFDLIFCWLTLPALLLCLFGESAPLAAGLAAASFTLNSGLLLLPLSG